MTITRTVNGVPFSYEDLVKLQAHNDTIQAIYDAVNDRNQRANRKRSEDIEKRG